ncbi:MAG: ABC-2 family transporter protein [archaeon]
MVISLHKFQKHLKLIPILLRMEFLRYFEYKINTIAQFFGELISILLMIVFWQSLFSKSLNIPGWDIKMIIFFIILIKIASSLYGIVRIIWAFDEYVVNGNLNTVLTKPVDTKFYLIVSETNPLGIISTLLYVLLLIVYSYYFTNFNIYLLIISILFCILGFVFLFILISLINLLAFWKGRMGGLRQLHVRIQRSAIEYPTIIFPQALQFFFKFFFPLSFVGTYPTLLYFNFTTTLLLEIFITQILLLIVFILIYNYFWKKGLKRYEGYGD